MSEAGHADIPRAGARIAVVTTSYPRAAGDPAGHFVRAAAASLLARGCHVEVFAAGKPPLHGTAVRAGPLVHWLGGEHLFGWPGCWARLRQAPWRAADLLGVSHRLRSALRARGPFDFLEAHWLLPTAWPLLGATTAPLTVVLHGADVRLLLRLPPRPRHAIVRPLAARGVRLHFVAHCSRDALLAALEPTLARALAGSSWVEPCPLELPEGLNPPARRAPAPTAAAAPTTVAVVGRLVGAKRTRLALEAAALLRPRPELAVIGDGPRAARLQQLARTRGLPAHFYGLLPRPEALRTLAAADLLLHCSAHEAAPTAVREARALGVPVVATPAGDLGRWARRDAGLTLVAPRATALASAMAERLARVRLAG